MKDQRVFERIAARFPLHFLDSSSGRESEAEAVDVSTKGIGLVMAEQLSPGTPLEMWVEPPGYRRPLYIRGKVAWAHPIGAAMEYRAGVCLEEACFMELVKSLQRTGAG